MSEVATWNHASLQKDLAQYLDKRLIVLQEIPLGRSGSMRADVLSLATSYNPKTRNPTIYEIKISLNDMRRDLAEGKSLHYYDFASRVFFCFPGALKVNLDEIPPIFGVMIRTTNTWRVARRCAARGHDEWSDVFWMKLLMRAWDELPRAEAERLEDTLAASRALQDELTEDIQAWRRDRDACERNIEVAKQDLETMRARVKSLKDEYDGLVDEIRVNLGIEHPSLLNLAGLRRRMTGETIAANLVRDLKNLQGQVEVALQNLEPQ